MTIAMSLIQDDWVAQKIEQTADQAWTKHPETNSAFDVTTAVSAGRRAGGHSVYVGHRLHPVVVSSRCHHRRAGV